MYYSDGGSAMYLNINRVEFVVTNLCTGRCKHCSVGNRIKDTGYLQYEWMKDTLVKLCDRFIINSVMCFGGEPLLYYNEVKEIMTEATGCNIPKRQLITNGYFSKDPQVIRETAAALKAGGLNDILLSADAFHQETIPIEPVYEFAREAKEHNLPIRLHPAWVVDQEHENEYNLRTRQVLARFEDLRLSQSKGNNIFPSGKAIEFLSEYFPKKELDLSVRCGQEPYSSKLDDVNTISIAPNGDISVCNFVIGNGYREDINTIIDRYNPYDIPETRALLEGGILGLLHYASAQGVNIDLSEHYSVCGVCRALVDKLARI